MEDPIFILGCPRSGTTLLSSLLTHTRYGAPVESHFITKYYKKLDCYGDLTKKANFVRLLTQILKERPVQQWKLKMDPESLFKELEPVNYKELINGLFMKRSEAKNRMSWGDKTPSYILDVDILYKLFPNAKYVYIVRDGRDVALSLLQKPWGPRNIFSCAHYWKLCNAPNPVFDHLKDKNQLYVVRYEDLLADPNSITRNLYSFLNEEIPSSKVEALLARIRNDNHGNWKKVMTSRETEIFESIASRTLNRFGYEASYDERGVNMLLSGYYELQNCVGRAIYLFKLNTLDTFQIRFFGKQPFTE